ncbi:unnamed protein product [Rotaria magnacalcarata]|uniref:Uncharacterized protein n=1 Tax=Rotaria magnacalcarata TaxID=392030 RepID=A0A816Q3S2_9BILA|nr:unnamed protein product [Rotaria magnacalcarata]
METYDEISFDTDLDDDDETDQTNDCIFPRLSFDAKLIAHRSNRLNQTFGQIGIPIQSTKETQAHDDILIPIRFNFSAGTMRMYEKSCHMLDSTMDWQLRSLLAYDNIAVVNRSLSFNDIRAFSTAIEANLECLTLSCVGLTSRSINMLCQGLPKCVHLNLLNLSWNKINKQSFEILVDTINHLPLLIYLSLSNCGIRDSYGRPIGEICRHKRLMDINLNGNEFEEMACIFIGNALTDNMSLKDLNISWNFIRSYATIALLRGFETNRTLTNFDISWSNLGYDGSVALRRVLIVNQILLYLNISNCNINWTSAKLISEATKTDSMRKIIEHIDQRHWRTLDYFRILNSKKTSEERKATITENTSQKLEAEDENDTIEKFQRSRTDRVAEPFTFKTLSTVINQQRVRDRLLKTRQEKQEKDLKNRNKRILETVNEYFPAIEIVSKQEKHKEAIEKLSKPRISSSHEKI